MIFSVLALETISDAATGVDGSSAKRNQAVTGTMVLNGGGEYAVVSCDLGMTARKGSALGGASPYVDVEVSIVVNVQGPTAAACAASYERLITRIAQGRRWINREGVEAVRLRVRLQGGTNDYTAVVLGSPDGEPPTSFVIEEDAVNTGNFLIRNVELRFVRRGLWYRITAIGATTASTNLKEVGTLTFTESAAIPTATELRMGLLSGGTTLGTTPGFLVVSSSATGIQRVNAKDYSASTGTVAIVAEAAGNRSVSGQIARFTAAGGTITVGIPTLAWTQLALFATVRVNTVAGAWDLSAAIESGGGAYATQDSPRRTEYAAGVPQTVFLGIFSAFRFQTSLVLSAVGNTGTLDIDCLYLARADIPLTILSLRASATAGFARSSTVPGFIAPRDYWDRQPFAGTGNTLGAELSNYTYQGDVFITTQDTGLAFVALDGGVGTAWREGSAGVSYAETVTASRFPAAFTPQ